CARQNLDSSSYDYW
nr:immunoglobulin heavy chain junction region [Macaca mulatta]MOX91520.1 immunoglobulin heavy chain junction region [Macaca mulatta]MOX91574.1 immunoglobulin heavy chain junction region [Macaca mulatta]MOX91785.1 immunoglobulin heavy chain junction region [Macaca mulatta]MOX91810.1 immunoglobulin heavy chain junction region [Macaca mulatta]